jgi:hypothetical protein
VSFFIEGWNHHADTLRRYEGVLHIKIVPRRRVFP